MVEWWGVAGISGGGLSRRNVLRGVVGGGIVAADVMMLSQMEAMASGRPRVYTRKEWGAVAPKKAIQVLKRAPDHIIVHHTASPNSANVSRAHAFALSREIQAFHMKKNGWDDIGEQFTIGRGGQIMEGRKGSLASVSQRRLVVGAQSLHNNEHTVGIENEGLYMKAAVPAALWKSLVATCAWLCQAYDLEPSKAILGHRDYNDTDCPGDVLYKRLPELRRAVAKSLDAPLLRMTHLDPGTPAGRPSRHKYDHGPAANRLGA